MVVQVQVQVLVLLVVVVGVLVVVTVLVLVLVPVLVPVPVGGSSIATTKKATTRDSNLARGTAHSSSSSQPQGDTRQKR
jgi:hypothetical protein